MPISALERRKSAMFDALRINHACVKIDVCWPELCKPASYGEWRANFKLMNVKPEN